MFSVVSITRHTEQRVIELDWDGEMATDSVVALSKECNIEASNDWKGNLGAKLSCFYQS